MSLYRTVLVTGASAGFGLAICKKLASEGYRVIAAARRQDRLERLSENFNGMILPLKLDVSDFEAVDAVIDSLPDDFRNVDVLINNAGLALGQDKAFACELKDWQTMVDTNIKGLLNITHKLLPLMVERNRGYIINLGSTAGSWPYTGGNVYGGTKAFVEQFSRNLRCDLAGTAIKVTVIKPGLCSDTEFSVVRFKGDREKAAAVYKDAQAIRPEDIADTVSFLLGTKAHVNINELEIMPVCQTFGGLSVNRNPDVEKK